METSLIGSRDGFATASKPITAVLPTPRNLWGVAEGKTDKNEIAEFEAKEQRVSGCLGDRFDHFGIASDGGGDGVGGGACDEKHAE